MTSKVIDALTRETGASPETIRRIVATSPVRYKVYAIPKKNGRGVRIIAQPAKEVKVLQRLAVTLFLTGLPVHSAAHAYRIGRGIRTNADVHCQSRYLVKLDFSRFFPSIVPDDWRQHLTRNLPGAFAEHELSELCSVFFWQPRKRPRMELSIGAPSSPFISNSIVYDLDVALSAIASERRAQYTRYADDLCFSASDPHVLDDVERCAREVLKQVPYPRLKLNASKTIYASKRGRRSVTGVVLSNDGHLSLGRQKKRLIRATLHAQRTNKLTPEDARRLGGLLSHARDIEPGFVERLEQSMSKKGL